MYAGLTWTWPFLSILIRFFCPFLPALHPEKCIHWFWELDMIIHENLRFAAVLFSIFYHPEFFSNSEIPWTPSDATTRACLPRDKVPHCQAQSISQALPEPLIEEALMGGEVSLDGRFAVFSAWSTDWEKWSNTLVVCSDFNIAMLPSDIQQDSASAGPSSQRELQIYLILNN